MKFLLSKHIQLIVLVKTKVKKHKANKVIQHIDFGWLSYDNYPYATNGKVWIR